MRAGVINTGHEAKLGTSKTGLHAAMELHDQGHSFFLTSSGSVVTKHYPAFRAVLPWDRAP